MAHGWGQANRIPLFRHDPEIIDADLCVIVTRKMYMIAKFHYMGDNAWEPSAMPDSFEVVGVNNNAELLEYDHTRLVMAAFVCHLTGFKQIDRAIGGVYDMTMTRRTDDEAAREAERKLGAESIVTWTTRGGVTEADCDLIDKLTSEHAQLIVGLANMLRNNPADRVLYCYATEQLVAAADAMLSQWKERTREPYDRNRMHVTICHDRYCTGRSATIDVVFQYGEKQDGE